MPRLPVQDHQLHRQPSLHKRATSLRTLRPGHNGHHHSARPDDDRPNARLDTGQPAGTTSLTISTSRATNSGTYTVTITGTSGTTSHNITATVTVTSK